MLPLRILGLLPLLAVSSANVLFEGATIVAFDEASNDFRILRNASLLVENDRISEVSEGPITTALGGETERIDARGKIITPGFINTHTHLWQTAFKTIGSNATLADYIQKFGATGPASTVFTAEDTYLSQLTGSLELIYEGTTTALDHAHGAFSRDISLAELNGTVDSGIRTFYAMALQPAPNFPIDGQIELLQAVGKEERFTDPNSLVKIGFSYDPISGEDEELIERIWNVGQEINASVITLHYLGGPWGFGNSPELTHRYGWLNTSIPVVFSHASYIDPVNSNLLRSTNQYISSTPESELHFGHGNPFVHLIQDQASLGSDSHFTYSVSMVGQARTWLQTLRARNYDRRLNEWTIPINSPMSVRQALYLITRAGALSLRQPDLGIIAPGAKADLVVFDTSSPAMLGWDDAIAAIILHSSPGDVEHVMVNGEFAKRDRKLVYEGYEDVRERFTASARRIQQVWRDTEFPPLEGLYNGGPSTYARTDVIDTLRGNGTGY